MSPYNRIILFLEQKKQHFLRLYGKTERNIFVSFCLATEGFEELPIQPKLRLPDGIPCDMVSEVPQPDT